MSEPMICLCGTTVPASGIDFEPGCRHCDRLKAFRGFEEVA